MCVLGCRRQCHIELDSLRSRNRTCVGQRERGGDIYIPIDVSGFGVLEVRVLECRVRQTVAIGPRLEIVVQVVRKLLSPEIEKRFDTDLVIVLVSLWGSEDKIADVAFVS